MNETNPLEYEQIAREVFAPIYPVIAKQIIEETRITQGKCLEVGTGPGFLGLALAEISDLELYLLDISQEMIEYAIQNIQTRKLDQQVQALCADVHQLPFSDQSIDLVISRGSVFFWDDLHQAFQEIYRVLAPGGMTYIGGGFGSNELKEQIERKMTEKDWEWSDKSKKRMEHLSSSNIGEILDDLNVSYEIRRDPGFWIIIRKEV